MERSALLALLALTAPQPRKHLMKHPAAPLPRFQVMPATKVPFVLRDNEHPDGPQDYPFKTERNATAAAADLARLRDLLPAKSPASIDVYGVLAGLAEEVTA